MAVTRIYTRTGTQTSPGTKLDADIDNTNNAFNAHEASTDEHGATGAIVGTTNSQTLTNKTIVSPTITGSIKKFSINREAVAADATLNVNTVIAGVSTLAADVTVTIPSSEIATSGRVWVIIDETGTAGSTYDIIIVGEGGETISGETSVIIDEPYGGIELYSNGTNLFIK